MAMGLAMSWICWWVAARSRPGMPSIRWQGSRPVLRRQPRPRKVMLGIPCKRGRAVMSEQPPKAPPDWGRSIWPPLS